MAGRRPRGVPRAPNPPCRSPKTTAKIILTQNEGRAGRSQARGAPRGCALQEVKAEGSSAPRSWERLGTLSKAVTPDPSSFSAASGLTPCPLPPPRPPSQKTSAHTSPLSQSTLCSPAAVSLCVITLSTPRGVSAATAAACYGHSAPPQLPHKADLPTSSSFLCFALNFLKLADILFGFSGFKCLYVLVRTRALNKGLDEIQATVITGNQSSKALDETKGKGREKKS